MQQMDYFQPPAQKNRRVDQEGEVNAPNVCCLEINLPKRSAIGKGKMKIIFNIFWWADSGDFFQFKEAVVGVDG